MEVGVPFRVSCLLLILTCVAFADTSVEDESSLDHNGTKFVKPEKAKRFLRVKRGWRIKRLWGEERREENRDKERNRENSHRAWLNSHCSAHCWSSWSSWTGCNHRCGNAGVQKATRHRSPPSACSSWHGSCSGSSSKVQSCNRRCYNGGSARAGSCSCKSGYKGTCCEHRITCGYPGTPSNGKVSPGGSVHNYSVTVTYSCNTGFRLIGNRTRQCTSSATWTGATPTCQPVTCPNVKEIDNGTVQGSDFSYGKSVVYTCDSGYRLHGSSSRTCAADGNWNTDAPSCNPVPCIKLSSPPGGSVAAPSSPVYGNRATYRCNMGYYMQGSGMRTCLPSGQWGGSKPHCKRITCPTLSTIQHGTVSPRTGSYGGSATYSCSHGYILSGNQHRKCSGSGPRGVWSGSQPTCKAVDCGDPGSPASGKKVNSTYTYSHVISFQCMPGYFMTGQSSVTCQATGRWTGTKPTCTACSVNKYKSGSNSQKVCNSCPAHSHTLSTGSSDHRKCVCDVGHQGPAGGPCKEIRCAALAIPAHGSILSCETKVNSACIFDCTDGFIVARGDRKRKCGLDGKWTGTATKCAACPKDTFKGGPTLCSPCPSHSYTTGTGNVKTGCVCKLGYSGPNGGPCTDVDECGRKNGGCEQKCQNTAGSFKCTCNIPGFGVDQDNVKECIATRMCSAFPKPDNGGAVCSLIFSTNTRRCQVKCNPGYEHLDKPNTYEQCGPDTDWQWSYDIRGGDIPPCVEEFFPGVQSEIEMFYYISDCASLTAAKKVNIRKAFIEMLQQQGACKQGNQDVCFVDDVRINCGKKDDFGYQKRSADASEAHILDIKFNLKVHEIASRKVNCARYCLNVTSESCKENCPKAYQSENINTLKSVSENLQEILTYNGKWDNSIDPSSGMAIKVGSEYFFPVTSGIKVTSVKYTCDVGSVSRHSGSRCMGCPAGTFATGDMCEPCPLRTHQPRPQQTRCLPCPPRSTTVKVGSKSCIFIKQ